MKFLPLFCGVFLFISGIIGVLVFGWIGIINGFIDLVHLANVSAPISLAIARIIIGGLFSWIFFEMLVKPGFVMFHKYR